MAKKPGKVVPFAPQKIGPKPNSSPKIDVSASSVGREPALNESDLRIAVARIIANGSYFQSVHAFRDRAYRNVSNEDIEELLAGPWKLSGTPEWDEPHRNWKYKLDGHDIDGDELSLIVTVNLEELILGIVTKF